jgi:hypothetical protein
MIARAHRSPRWGLAWLLLLCVVPALACGPDKKAKKVRISVVVILASETDTRVDRKLECIAREVRKMHPKLKGFRLEKLSCKSLPVGKADTFTLVEDHEASITVQKAADKMDRIQLTVGPPMMGDITYSTPCGKFLPIVTPLSTKKGEKVIIAVRVQPCQKK